ncbi:MAG TPA: SRPBCC family protein [Anaerolineales bacterium]|nr:SRPBCC family protein [Anaerolineales bacterium]
MATATKDKAITAGKTHIVAEPGKQEIVITRLFDVPRERLFKVMNDPELLPQWWGPERYTTTVEKMDVRPGGSWRFVQAAADGGTHAFHGVYHEVRPPERLVYTFEYEGVPGHVTMDTITFEDTGGKTLLREQSVFQSVEDRDGMVQSGMEEGANASMERLEALLTKAQ